MNIPLTTQVKIFTLSFFLLMVTKGACQWESIITPVTTNLILYDISFPPGQSDVGYTGGAHQTFNGQGKIMKTVDGGTTWQVIFESTAAGSGVTAIHFFSTSVGYAGTQNGDLMRTINGGTTWTTVDIDPTVNQGEISDIVFYDSNNALIVTVWGGIYRTVNGGATWTSVAVGPAGVAYKVAYADANNVFAIGNGQTIYKSSNGGNNWTTNFSGPAGGLINIGMYFLDADNGIVTSEDGAYFITANGGTTWTPSVIPGQGGLMRGALMIDTETIYVIATPGAVYKTVDGGANWTLDSPFDFFPSYYRIIQTDNGTLFVCGSGSTGGTILRNTLTPPVLTVEKHITDVVCNGESTGSVSLTVSGGTMPYFYNWSDDQSSNPAINLSADTYTVTVSDSDGNEVVVTAVVNESDAITVDANVTNVQCNNTQTGAIDLTISGGTPSYDVIWSPGGQVSEDLTDLGIGTYTAEISDNNGCSTSTMITITEPDVLGLSGEISDVLCHGEESGGIEITITGGTEPYDAVWSPSGQTTIDLDNVGAGLHGVVITDANNCMINMSWNVEEPTDPIMVNSFVNDATCNGSNGAIDLEVSGGTPSYEFSWSSPSGFSSSTQNLTDLPADTYTVTITDMNNCILIESVTVGFVDIPILSTTIQHVSCGDGNDGAIDLLISGDSGPYNVLWSPNGETTEDIDNLTAGDYFVAVVDFNGCEVTASTTVSEPDALSLGVNLNHVSCHGEQTGAIEISIAGGTGDYSILWSPGGETTGNLNGLTAGTYSVVVSDENDCTITETWEITESAILSTSAIITNASCGTANGAIDLTVNGGTPDYTYSWTGPNGFTSEDEDLTALEPGNYTAIITDMNDCTTTATATIDGAANGTLTLTTSPVTCNGGSDGMIAWSLEGGVEPYTVEVTPGGSLESLSAGEYEVMVTDGNNCASQGTAIITEPEAIVLNSTLSHILCNGAQTGAIDLSITGGTGAYSVVWSPGGETTEDISDLAAGTYSVQVIDENNCSVTESWELTEPATGLSTSSTVSNTACGAATGTISLTVNGGTPSYTYSWVGPNGFTSEDEDLTGLGVGEYTATITDMNGCTIIVTATVQGESSPTLTATPTHISCNGGSDGMITLSIEGGTEPYTTTVEPGGSLENLSAGEYNITVSDGNNCAATTSVTMTEPESLILSADLTHVLCHGDLTGAIDLTISGGTGTYAVVWSPGGETTEDLTDLAAGIYSVQVTDENNCSVSETWELTEPATGLSTSSTVSNTACGAATGTINLTVNGGTPDYTYSWTGPNGFTSEDEDLIDLGVGMYMAIITDMNGCTITATAIVEGESSPVLTATSSPVSCNGGSDGMITLSIEGGTEPYTTVVEPGGSLENLSAGEYTITVSDGNNCAATISATITEPEALTLSADLSHILCHGDLTGAIDLTISGGTGAYTVVWSPDGETIEDLTDLAAGSYSVLVTDENNCSITESWELTEPLTGLSTSTTITSTTCGAATGTINLTVNGGTPGYIYSWTGPDGFTSEDEDLSDLTAGMYTVMITDMNGCTISATATVDGEASPTLAVDTTPVSCNGGSDGVIILTINGGTAPYTTTVEPGGSLENLSAGEYTITVADVNSCSSTITAVITEPQEGLSSTTSITNAGCGTATGAIDLTVNGGTPGYTYSWTGPDGFTSEDEDLSDLAAGLYTCIVTDMNGCTISVSATIAGETSPTFTLSIVPVTCNGGSDGMISILDITGGTPPYITSVDPGGVLENLSAGNYTITVTDANNCSSTTTATVSEPEALLITVDEVVDIIDGVPGSIQVSISGGIAPYLYAWFNENGDIVSEIEDPTITVSGDYNLVLTDANDCTVQSNNLTVTMITDVEEPSFTETVNIYPNPTSGIISLINVGNKDFDFSIKNVQGQEISNLYKIENSIDVSNLPSGVYFVTIMWKNETVTKQFVKH